MSVTTLVNLTHYTDDDFVMDTTIEFDPDQEVTSLTGATAEVKAKSRVSVSAPVITGITVIDVPNSKIRSSFLPDDLARGVYDIQLSVTISGKRKTPVAGTLTVKDSL